MRFAGQFHPFASIVGLCYTLLLLRAIQERLKVAASPEELRGIFQDN
jgi:Na+-translocating ferredoxin:NAD+ oxidoreductase RnfA subunit